MAASVARRSPGRDSGRTWSAGGHSFAGKHAIVSNRKGGAQASHAAEGELGLRAGRAKRKVERRFDCGACDERQV